MKKPRLLVLTTSYPSHPDQPASIFIARLLNAMRKRGYTPTVIAPTDGTVFGQHEVAGIQTIRFGYFIPRSLLRLTRIGGGIPENLSASLLAKLQILPMMLVFLLVALKEIRRHDVIYAHWFGAGLIGAMLNLLTGVPMMISPLGDDGYLARDHWLWRILAKWVCKRSSVIAPNSRELIQILVDLGVKAEKIHFYRMGIDTDLFHPAQDLQNITDEVHVAFVGSLIERKGAHDLLEAMADDSLNDVKMRIVGDGNSRDDLEAMAAKLGLMERITWEGMVSPSEEARILQESDIFCLPSYMEGTPNVVYEAMASGLPVISTRVGGIPQQVQEGKTGLLFDPGDVQQLRKCLMTLVNKPELRRSMGKAGRDWIINSRISWDASAEEFDEVFTGLVNQTDQ